MLKELGISAGTAIFILIALYFVVKWAVRTAIEESKGEIAKAVKKGLRQFEEEKQEAEDFEDPEDE